MLKGRSHHASTEVLRPEPTGAQVTALVLATFAGPPLARRALVRSARPLDRAGGAGPPGFAGRGLDRVGRHRHRGRPRRRNPGAAVPYTVKPGARWARLPTPLRGTVKAGRGALPTAMGTTLASTLFTVSQTRLGVYADADRGPGTRVEVQSTPGPTGLRLVGMTQARARRATLARFSPEPMGVAVNYVLQNWTFDPFVVSGRLRGAPPRARPRQPAATIHRRPGRWSRRPPLARSSTAVWRYS